MRTGKAARFYPPTCSRRCCECRRCLARSDDGAAHIFLLFELCSSTESSPNLTVWKPREEDPGKWCRVDVPPTAWCSTLALGDRRPRDATLLFAAWKHYEASDAYAWEHSISLPSDNLDIQVTHSAVHGPVGHGCQPITT